MTLKETVTVTRDVPQSIADLVYFVRWLDTRGTAIGGLSDEQLIKEAREFYDERHGEE
jgi:hypothetical protein